MTMHRITLGCVIAGLASSAPATAAVIAATSFNGATISGAQASGLVWDLSGVADPGALTAIDVNASGSLAGLFTTPDATGRFVPDLNIHNEGPWRVDVPLMVLGNDLTLTAVHLNVGMFNNSGNLQTVGRHVSVMFSITDALNNEIGTGSAPNVFENDLAFASNPLPVSADLGAVDLAANSNYTFSIFVSGVGPGNNAGIDNLSIEGVPEPGTGVLLGLALLGPLCRRRR